MKITVNACEMDVQPGMTILEAARSAGIHIPTLCYLKGINEISACRICLVQVNGMPRPVPACSTKVSEGMAIETDNARIRDARRKTLELIVSNHRMECTECPRGADCELRELCKEYAVDDKAYGMGKREEIIEDSTPYLVRDNSKCVLCRRCVSTCTHVQGIGAIAANLKGGRTNIGFPTGLSLQNTNCVACGQCVAVCPTGALSVHEDTKLVWKALYNKSKTVVIAITPAAAYSIGKFFGEKDFSDNGPKVVSILHKIGFDIVIDAGAWEKEYETIELNRAAERIEQGQTPVISASDQAMIRYMWQNIPEMAERLLDLPLPSEFIAQRVKKLLSGKDVFFVSIDTALSPKSSWKQWVDVHITARELFALIRRACVSNFTAEQVWNELASEPYDQLMDQEESRSPVYEEPFCAEEKTVGNTRVRICRVTGLGNAKKALLDASAYDFLKVCASPGGPLYAGGGSPVR